MKLTFTRQYNMNPRQLLRRCGYAEFVDPRTGETSYTRRLSGGFYPRFHAYLERKEVGFQVNIHLDQKQASYHGQTKHSGEYEGEVVEREVSRLHEQIEALKLK